VSLADYKPAITGVACIFLALASAATTASAEGLEPAENVEERIEAIRNALVNRALQSKVHVRGVSWIDESGRLREHTLITSDLKVRGIRINAYVENDKLRESVVIDAAASIASDKNCTLPNMRLRRPALLDIHFQPKNGHSAQFQLAQIARALEKQVETDFAGKGSWQLQKQTQLSAYAQIVNFGYRQSAPYRIRIDVNQSSNAQHATNAFAGIFRGLFGLPQPPEAPQLTLAISLTETGSNRIVWSDTTPLPLPVSIVSMHSRQPEQELKQAITRAITDWSTKIEALLKCEPVFFNLTVLADGQHLINAGSVEGIRLHDKFVIVDQARFPANVLTEVESVFRNAAKVRIQGSYTATTGGRWVALPL
jgi:hypothetical protein